MSKHDGAQEGCTICFLKLAPEFRLTLYPSPRHKTLRKIALKQCF